ncbi:MAG: zinc ribbon domain-containing protein [Candidatus Lokiarchaeota archaeon]|nr:zinc ribbon domain-containing protein [Candidatus Lokiarchaeota archaeon]
MDIAKFNKELSYKVAKANGLEKNNKLNEAIEIWLNVSEMALKMSKTPNLEFSYKSMLMEKTEQIIAHIKDLKSRLSGQKEVKLISKGLSSSKIEYIDEDEDIQESHPIAKQAPVTKDSKINPEIDIIEESDIKNLPIGFKEIKPKKDFKIVTPHDENYVKDMLKKEVDMDIFKHSNTEENSSQRVEFEQPVDKNKIICFACGTEIPSKSNKCPNCGTNLKK